MKPAWIACWAGLLIAGCAAPRGRTPAEPYDEAASGDRLVSDALAQAHASGKRVLLVFGANWCSDCRALDALFQSDPAIARRLRESYVVVKLDVGREAEPRKHAHLIGRFGAAVETGIPVLVVADANGRTLNDTHRERLADSAHQRPAAVLDFLDQWRP